MNHIITKSFRLLGLLLPFTSAFSQTTLNATSHSGIINETVFEYSIGEMTLVSTENNTNLTVTQGYFQPQLKKQTILSDSHLKDYILVYPNPTENRLTLEINKNIIGNFDYCLINISGKILISKKGLQIKGGCKQLLDLSSFSSGFYFLRVDTQEKESNNESYIFKIQKIK